MSRRWRKIIIILSMLALITGVLLWFVPPVTALVGGPVEVTRWDRDKGKIDVLVGQDKPGWIATSTISRHVLHAIIVAEDARFYQHSGLDYREIWSSLQTNIEKRRFARGASTITQQVVKMALLSREKSLLRKSREMTGAILLETLLEKDEILEWYINLAEFGDGVYGIREGCWHYFNTKPELLTIEQSIHLALVLPSPNRWSFGLRQKKLTEFGHQRFAYLVNRMRRNGYITETQWFHAMSTGDFGRPITGYTDLLAAREKYDRACSGEQCKVPEEDSFFDEMIDVEIPPVTAPAEGEDGSLDGEETPLETSPQPDPQPDPLQGDSFPKEKA